MEDFDVALQKHLQKCELEFRAKQLPHGSNVEWLTPHCNNVQDIAKFLRYLGFKIQEIVDEVDAVGDPYRWVKTTSGIIVYTNAEYSDGFVAASSKN